MIPKMVVVIPARFDSKRFPGKPLALVHGEPMIVCVWKRAMKIANVSEVIVATDNPEIANVIQKEGGMVRMTNSEHQSGTDRVAEVTKDMPPETIVINVQGDMPLFNPVVVEKLGDTLIWDNNYDIATPVIIHKERTRSLTDRNVVKVVFDLLLMKAVYFSRHPILYFSGISDSSWCQHIGMYAYRNSVLQALPKSKPTRFECLENLEQLRFLELGYPIRIVPTTLDCGIDVNCPADLKRINK